MKGFFFAIAIFLLMGYILLSISAWTTSVQINEQRLAERFALTNARTVLHQVGEGEVQRIVRIIVYNSMYALNERTRETPLKAGSGDEEFLYVQQSMEQLVLHGQADAENFQDSSTGPLLLASDSVEDWLTTLDASLGEIGYRIVSYDIHGFSISQTTPDAVDYALTISLRAESRNGRAFVEREYAIADSIPIAGFVDPAIARNAAESGMRDGDALEKQFFFHDDYPTVEDSDWLIELNDGDEGQGWFYGKIIMAADADDIEEQELRPLYILAGTYSEITSLGGSAPYTDFGAYILTNAPDTSSAACGTIQSNTFNPIVCTEDGSRMRIDTEKPSYTDKPYAVAPGFNPASLDPKGPGGAPALLFIAENDADEIVVNPALKGRSVQLFNIENLRDFTLCGYYTQSTRAPSYFQRMLENSFSRESPLGIETMLVGGYIGGEGEDLPIQQFYPDSRSRLDRELFVGEDGLRVRGMPGCKNTFLCNGKSLIGHFRLGDEGQADYLDGDYIHCGDGRAEC